MKDIMISSLDKLKWVDKFSYLGYLLVQVEEQKKHYEQEYAVPGQS